MHTHRPNIPIAINGIEVQGFCDTGSDFNIVNLDRNAADASADELYKATRETSNIVKGCSLRGVGGGTIRVKEVRTVTITIKDSKGEATLKDIEMLFLDRHIDTLPTLDTKYIVK